MIAQTPLRQSPGGPVARSRTRVTGNAVGESASAAAWYTVDGENAPGGAATVASRASTIAFDGSAATGALLPGPADLLAAALAACILKTVERFSGLLPFTYQRARVHVEIERQEPPPRIVRARYTLRIVTDEPQQCVAFVLLATRARRGRHVRIHPLHSRRHRRRERPASPMSGVR